MDPIAELTKVLPAELLSAGALFVLVVQMLKQGIARVGQALPKWSGYALLALNYVLGAALALTWEGARVEGIFGLVWVQAILLGTYMVAVYHAGKWAFTDPAG